MSSAHRKLISVGVVLASLMGSGCFSMTAQRHYTEEMKVARQRKAIVAGYDAEVGGPAIAVDITAWDYVKEHPFIATGAAVADGLTLYGLYRGVQAIADSANGGGDDNRRDKSTHVSVNNTGSGDVVVVNTSSSGDATGNNRPSENDWGTKLNAQ